MSAPVEYVRRLRSGGFLVYHDRRCRYVTGAHDWEPVTAEEVEGARLNIGTVRFRGRVVMPWPCRVCIPPRRDWPSLCAGTGFELPGR